MVKEFYSIFKSLYSSLEAESNFSIVESSLDFQELPEGFKQLYQDHLTHKFSQSLCVTPFNEYQIDYVIREKSQYSVLINTPTMNEIIKKHQIQPCSEPNFVDLTEGFLKREIITDNHSQGNHVMFWFESEGFSLFEVKNQQFQAPINQLRIYSNQSHYLIHDINTQFYLLP